MTLRDRTGHDDQDPWVVAEDLTARLPGVGSVVFTTSADVDEPVEIQVFSHAGADRHRLREQVTGLVRELTHDDGPIRVVVLELAGAEPPAPPDASSGHADRAASRASTDGGAIPPTRTQNRDGIELLEGARPVLVAADVRRRGEHSQATVLLKVGHREVTGTAERPSTARDLGVVAEATLEAVRRATPTDPADVSLRGVALAEMLEGRAVCVRLARQEPPARDLFGAALEEEGDTAATTARATLDALNRQL